VDGWTSRGQEGYFAITAHYIDDNFESKSALLQYRVFPGPHTRANISQDLQRVISQWNLNKKVRLVVADNAANVQNSIKELNLKNFGCFEHTLNLIAKSAIALPEVDRLISKLKTIVTPNFIISLKLL
jgi:hypothetical protein